MTGTGPGDGGPAPPALPALPALAALPTLDDGLASALAWDERGLVPAVVCHAETGSVLMLGWMNAEALAATLTTGSVHFYSRSRAKLWRKGETSGHTLEVAEVRLDCDGDALLVSARPVGPTCHTGKPSCFFRREEAGNWQEDAGPAGAPAAILDRLYEVLESRRGAAPESSYTASLLAGGADAITAKIAEESAELNAELASASGDAKRIAHEAADVLYHVLVGLLSRGIEPAALWRELARRFGQSGHAEKASRR